MKTSLHFLLFGFVCASIGACGAGNGDSDETTEEHAPEAAEFERGPHGGRMLRNGAFVLELSIFETGVPPEFRARVTRDGEPVDPSKVQLQIQLTRLGGKVDQIEFSPEGDFLRGDTVVYEPHSFIVAIDARLDGKSHRFEYDNFEGRTQIGAEMAAAFGVQTEIAGPAELEETVHVYGRVVPNADRVRAVSARFDGLIVSTHAGIGDAVRAGQRLLSIESNESLQPYTIDSPIDGIVTARTANSGEQTDGRQLFTVIDPSSVWVELAIFPADRERVRAGAPVRVSNAGGDVTVSGTIDRVNVVANANQAVTARVVLENSDGRLPPGTYVEARIAVDRYAVPLAVRQSGLQSFRDFTVVYAQIGDEYEVRMLDLGRQDDQWIEVLGGLEPGTRYVSENSYVVKADIEKSGASHDH